MPRWSGPSRAQLISEIRENFREINTRASEIRSEVEETGIRSEFLSNQQSIFRALTNTASKVKFSTGNLSRFNKTRLNDILEQQRLFLNSQWSTPEGRAAIRQRQFETFQQRVPGITEEAFDNVRGFFSEENIVYSELVESGLLASSQAVDMMNSGITDTELINALDKIGENEREGIISFDEMPRGNIRSFIQYTAEHPVLYSELVESRLLTSNQFVDIMMSGIPENDIINALNRIRENEAVGVISLNEVPSGNMLSFIQYTALYPEESVVSIYERFSVI